MYKRLSDYIGVSLKLLCSLCLAVGFFDHRGVLKCMHNFFKIHSTENAKYVTNEAIFFQSGILQEVSITKLAPGLRD